MDNCKKATVLEMGGGTIGIGGGSTILWNWYSSFDLDKMSVDFYCYTKPSDPYVEVIRRNNNACFVVEHSDNIFRKRVNEILKLREIIKNQHYDCLHIHREGAYNHLLFFWLTKKYIDRFIVHGHNTSVGNHPVKGLLHRLFRPCLKGRGMIYLACSDDAAKWCFPSSVIRNKEYTVIKNGINTERFTFDAGTRNSIRKYLGIEGCFVIGHVGRFAYLKNHEFLIDTFAKVKKRCSNAVLLLIGGDSGEKLIDGIKEKVNSLGLAESVIFYGNTDRVNELYQAMDCFVFPSRHEGLGIVVIEAQAAGLKTLCSDGVPQEAIISDLCEYMPLTDGPEKWAEKILTYVNGYERKDMSKEIAAAGYDIRTSAKQLENIYFSCHREKAEKTKQAKTESIKCKDEESEI